jgi:hypothetical protein
LTASANDSFTAAVVVAAEFGVDVDERKWISCLRAGVVDKKLFELILFNTMQPWTQDQCLSRKLSSHATFAEILLAFWLQANLGF